jgi:hypothetical protein
MRNLIDRMEQLWCEHMHTATMWPIHGKYRCGLCLREYAVGFESTAPERPAARRVGERLAVSG